MGEAGRRPSARERTGSGAKEKNRRQAVEKIYKNRKRLMQLKFFSIPAFGEEHSLREEELNIFLRGHRVLNVRHEFVNNGAMSHWCCCVEYIEGSKPPEPGRTGSREKVDYRNVLSESDFEKFRILRECRKQLAEEEAVPPYAVFLDEHLAAIAQKAEINESALRSVNGVGEKKIEKYGKRFLELWEEKRHEKSGQSVLSDSGNRES